MAFELPAIEESERIANRIGLIDADCVAYWAAAGCDDMPVQAALRKVKDRMESICDQLQTDEIRCYLTGKNNFRDDIATYQIYKGNRYDKDGNRIKPQPKWLSACRLLLITDFAAELVGGQEADDALGIAQMKCNADPEWESIISSIDKDLRIIPGLHHDMTSGYIESMDEFGYLEIDAKKKVRGGGLMFFYAQLLMGDTADWIPGLPKVTQEMKNEFEGVKRLGGCGQKAAYAVLHDAETEWDLYERVLFCYSSYWNGDRFYVNWRTNQEVYPEPEQMLREQGRLLWMRHKEGELWEIPTFGG